eukprot:356174-Chlamydomonas_euryale.AAC.5
MLAIGPRSLQCRWRERVMRLPAAAAAAAGRGRGVSEERRGLEEGQSGKCCKCPRRGPGADTCKEHVQRSSALQRPTAARSTSTAQSKPSDSGAAAPEARGQERLRKGGSEEAAQRHARAHAT